MMASDVPEEVAPDKLGPLNFLQRMLRGSRSVESDSLPGLDHPALERMMRQSLKELLDTLAIAPKKESAEYRFRNTV